MSRYIHFDRDGPIEAVDLGQWRSCASAARIFGCYGPAEFKISRKMFPGFIWRNLIVALVGPLNPTGQGWTIAMASADAFRARARFHLIGSTTISND